MKTRHLKALALAAVSVPFLFFFLVRSFLPGVAARGDLESRQKSLVENIIRLIRDDYIDRVDAERTMEGAFRGLVHSLDMLSSYLNKDDLAKFRERNPASFRDTGLVLIKAPAGMTQVVGVEDGRPAARAGIRRGDFISSIDDRSTFGLSLLEVELRLCGKDDRPVKLRVVRQASTEELTVERSLPPAEDCLFTPEKNTAGILAVRRLSPSCLAALTERGENAATASPLILDLRGCAEGDWESARKFVNHFQQLPRAGFFLSRNGSREMFSCPEPAARSRQLLVIWVDHATRGPAEVAAGVLQSAGRAKVVGLPTLGLTAKQNLYPLQDGGALLLTTAVFCYASGDRLWEKGISPDIVLSEEASGRSQYLQKTLSQAAGR